MNLRIFNINTDKTEYIFGLDSSFKLSFNIESEQEYKISSIYIESGIHILLNGKIKDSKNEKYIVIKNDYISSGRKKSFSIDIPIEYPNIYREKSPLEIKNCFKIVIKIENNKSKISQEIYPNISLEHKEKNGHDINLYNVTKTEYLQMLDNYKNRISNIEKILHGNTQTKIDNYIIDYNSKELSNKVSKGLGDLCSQVPTKDNVIINKGLFGFNKDYVNKNFYEFICKNYALFNLREKLRNNIYIKSIYVLLFISIILLTIFNDSIEIIKFKTFNLWLMLISIIGISIPYFILLDKGLNIVRSKIIRIIPNKSNVLKKIIIDKKLNLKSIFKTIEINYDQKFKCEFNVYLACHLVGNKDKMIYNTEVYMINIGYYKGDKFHINNINDYTVKNVLMNMYIKPGEINKRSLFKIMPTYAKIEYNIIYSFESIDLSNKYKNIII